MFRRKDFKVTPLTGFLNVFPVESKRLPPEPWFNGIRLASPLSINPAVVILSYSAQAQVHKCLKLVVSVVVYRVYDKTRSESVEGHIGNVPCSPQFETVILTLVSLP